MKILLADDDDSLCSIIQPALEAVGHCVDWAPSGSEAEDKIDSTAYDLLILDWLMPGSTGISICESLRSNHNEIPIIMLTSRDTDDDEVLALDWGIDDFLTKPCNTRKLLAHVRAIARRQTSIPILRHGDLALDAKNNTVTFKEEIVNLSDLDFRLIKLLISNPSTVFSPPDLIEKVWSIDNHPQTKAVKAAIARVRKKLVKLEAPADFIQSVYGRGYRLKSLR